MPQPTQHNVSDKPFVCGHCGNKAVMYVICEGSEKFNVEDLDLIYIKTIALKCASCDDYNIIQEMEFINRTYLEFLEQTSPSEQDASIYERATRKQMQYLYPMARRKFMYVPDDVAKSYQIALKLLPIEPIACAVFIGRTLEFMCKERSANGKTLEKMLVNLRDRGDIPDRILDIANSLRFFRNISAHAVSNIEVSYNDVESLIALCEAILEYVYEAPAILQQAQDKANELKSATA